MVPEKREGIEADREPADPSKGPGVVTAMPKQMPGQPTSGGDDWVKVKAKSKEELMIPEEKRVRRKMLPKKRDE